MALNFNQNSLSEQNNDVNSEIMRLRNQGLTDNLITDELTNKGYSADDINEAMMQLDIPADTPKKQGMSSGYGSGASQGMKGNEDIYGRIEEIAESLIDEKWDDLIVEVKKIVVWKEKVEDTQRKLMNDLEKLKEDFKVLHEGVLGKLESYDGRMRDVGTELNAVGKVFKDVIPEFVENVKELSFIAGKVKERK